MATYFSTMRPIRVSRQSTIDPEHEWKMNGKLLYLIVTRDSRLTLSYLYRNIEEKNARENVAPCAQDTERGTFDLNYSTYEACETSNNVE